MSDEDQLARDASGARERRIRRAVLTATVLGSSMAIIDGTVVTVALPALQRDLGSTLADLQWVLAIYMLFISAFLLVGGVLGDRFGRKRVFVIGVTVFAIASAWCGLAPDPLQLIIARALQGLGGALLIPGSLAVISAHFPPEVRGRAFGTWAGFTAFSVALGPVLGGVLVDNASWRWVFFINLPVALIVLIVLAVGVPESRDETYARRLDLLGALLATLGLGAIAYGLIETAHFGLTGAVVIAAVVAGILLLVVFVWHQARSRAPMMPPGLFRSRTFSGANAITLLLYASLTGCTFFLPYNLIQVQGYSATLGGASLLPLIVLISALSPVAGRVVDRIGGRWLLTIGSILTAAGIALLSRSGLGAGYWSGFLPGLVVMGLGVGTAVAPLTAVAMSAVEARRVGLASGVNNTSSRVGSLMAVSVLGVVMLSAFNANLDAGLASLGLAPEAIAELDMERVKLAGAALPHGLDAETAARLRDAIENAFVGGFRLVMWICAGLALACAAIALTTIRERPARTPSAG